MKRRPVLVVVLCLAMGTTLLIAAAPAAASGPPGATAGPMKSWQPPTETPVLSPASGVWSWYSGPGYGWTATLGEYLYGWDNSERGTWTGTFKGTSVEPYTATVDLNTDSLWALITIRFKGSVDGHRGSAVIGLTVDNPSPFGETGGGHWVVMSGKGGLKHLFGCGLWMFTGADETHGYADYTGAYWLR